MSKTSFESPTFEGGRCFFYLEDVTSVQYKPANDSAVLGVVAARVVVNFSQNSSVLLPESECDRLFDALAKIQPNLYGN